jgi:hypothetical protein
MTETWSNIKKESMENILHKSEGLIHFMKRDNTVISGNKSLVQESTIVRKTRMARLLLSLSLSVGVYG